MFLIKVLQKKSSFLLKTKNVTVKNKLINCIAYMYVKNIYFECIISNFIVNCF